MMKQKKVRNTQMILKYPTIPRPNGISSRHNIM
jgi:hypothetical protein